MTQAITPTKAGEIMEAVIARGDLSKLTPEERAKYYVRVCESIGLNPMTKPFEYITLNGSLTLYARKDATDQLRTLHNVSVTELIETEREGVFIVTAKVANAVGRTDADKGAVNINGLKGDALANALLKAVTKAKRRATLSICGLGFLDETEIEDIPDDAKALPIRTEREPAKTLPKKDARGVYAKLQAELDAEQTCEALQEWYEASAERIRLLPDDWQDILLMRFQEHMLSLRQKETTAPSSTTADRRIVLAEIAQLMDIHVTDNPQRRAELLRTHFDACGEEIAVKLPLDRLKQGFDTMTFTLEGQWSRYHSAVIKDERGALDRMDELPTHSAPPIQATPPRGPALDHAEVDGVPAFLDRRSPRDAAKPEKPSLAGW